MCCSQLRKLRLVRVSSIQGETERDDSACERRVHLFFAGHTTDIDPLTRKIQLTAEAEEFLREQPQWRCFFVSSSLPRFLRGAAFLTLLHR